MMSLAADQFRFLTANLIGFSLAIPYKFVPRSLRNEYNFLPGIIMVYYCFGKHANTLVLFAAISYAICKFAPGKFVQRAMLCTSLAFLSYAHLSRQLMDYGGYVLDISGPFMIAVQKMTSLGYNLYDGNRKEKEKEKQIYISKTNGEKTSEVDSYNYNNNSDNNNNNNNLDESDKSLPPKSARSLDSTSSVIGVSSNIINKNIPKRDNGVLTEEQKHYAVTKVPTFNEFMGYFFHFPSVLCGPIMYFNDYRDFVNAPASKPNPPGRELAVAKKLTISITCAILHLTLNPKFEVDFLRSPQFLVQTPFLMRFCYILIFTMLSRLKYYVAWHLGEAISNTSGFGFTGFDTNGKPKWNLISNMDLMMFETSLNLRDAIHAWNKTTQSWLRRTAYERAPRKLSVLSTYLLSAIWHGFYPGYYMTFLGGALFTHAGRNGRRIVRPLFQKGKVLPKIYDVATFILTRLTIAYAAFPFVILDFRNNYEIYKSLYFSIHIIALIGVMLGLVVRKK